MDTQQVFSAALLRADLPVPAQLRQPDGQPAGKRFDVYRNNVVSSLIDAMVEGFPVTHRLLGEAYFRALAAMYVRANPPRSPVLATYGEQFAAFLAGFEPLAAYPYLSDVASLELASRDSHNAADQVPCAAEQLEHCTPDQLMTLVPIAHPSLRLLNSAYPVLEIWWSQQPGHERQPDLSLGPQCVQVIRPEMQVLHYALTAHEFAFAAAIDDVKPLSVLAAEVVDAFPDCDFVALMVATIQRGTIAQFRLPEEATA